MIRSYSLCYETVLSFVVCMFVIRNINYCCSCSFYTATLYIELAPIFSMHASAPGVCACLAKREQLNDQDNSAGRANWSLLAERCLNSYCSVVSLFCFDTLRNFSASLPRNVVVVAQRRTTSLGVLHRRGRCCWTRTINSTIPGVPWSFNGSGRVVSCEHGCWTRTRRHNSHVDTTVLRVTCRRTPTKSDFTDPRRKHVIVVNVRLTARLQSLPLARCCPACFALFGYFSLAVSSNINSCKLYVCMFWTLSYKRTIGIVCVAPNC